jgi:hypothetical protein
MTASGDPSDTTQNSAMRAQFIRILSARVQSVSNDPAQMRELVYELARIRLLEQFGHGDARHSRQTMDVFESAIREVERPLRRSWRPSRRSRRDRCALPANRNDRASSERPSRSR